MGEWWLCPNRDNGIDGDGCEHGAILHDAEDMEDRRPTCGAEGCRCGHGHA